MNTYSQILFQIIFTAKNHEKTLAAKNRPQLYKYIWGILKNKINEHGIEYDEKYMF